MKTHATLIALAMLTAYAARPAESADEKTKSSRPKIGMVVGRRAIVSGVRFACGAWSEHSRGTCPAAARGSEPKIAIYTRGLNKHVLKLAAAVDREIERDPALKWSFVEVIDKKGGAYGISGNYTSKERDERLEELRTAAAENKITRLTFGLANRGGAKETDRLGMAKETDVLVAFLGKSGNKSRMVKYAKRLRFSELDEKKIMSLLHEIAAVRK